VAIHPFETYSNLSKEQLTMKRLGLILGIVIAVTAIAGAYVVIDRLRSAPYPISAPEGSVATSPQQPTLEITYIANEGVLIASGEKQVLIDGLHREYKPDYAFLPTPEREKIESAKAPFDKIDLILVSHMHLDHFHPESVGLHLRHNPKTVLVSSQQVIDEVAKKFNDYEAIKARVTGATPPLKEKVAMKVAGIDFEILGLGHGGGRWRWIQNIGHVINLGGKKLLHVGDVDASAEIFDKLELDQEGIDIAFLPVWFLLEPAGQTVVRERIKPKQIIVVHISPAEAEDVVRRIKQVFPEAVAFTTLLDKRRY
jgi:L-ascorbate metabolism protein UlaG (beta-lactamase superfamily)